MPPTTFEEYLALLSEEQAATLQKLRGTIAGAAPGAEEGFSYGMPGFLLEGRTLMWYAAWKRHYSLYPVGAALLEAAGLTGYETSKGTLRFPADQPIPYEVVEKLVSARIAEMRESGR